MTVEQGSTGESMAGVEGDLDVVSRAQAAFFKKATCDYLSTDINLFFA